MSKILIILTLGLLMILANTAWAAGRGQLEITVVDRQTGKPIACRMHLKNASGKPRKAKRAPFWHDHFVFPGKISLDLPTGNYTFDLERGPEYVTRSGHFRIDPFADDTKQIDLARFVDMAADGWYSGDLLAEIQVMLPKDLSDADRQLLDEIGRRYPENPRDKLQW